MHITSRHNSHFSSTVHVKTSVTFGAILAMVIGGIIALVGVKFGFDAKALTSNGLTASGVVLKSWSEDYRDHNGKRKVRNRSEVEFDAQGQGSIKVVLHSRYAEGSSVPLIYDPSDPTSARANSFGSVWGNAATFLFIGGLVVALGGVALRLHKRRLQEIEWLRSNGRKVSASVIGINSTTRKRSSGRSRSYSLIVKLDERVPGAADKFNSETLDCEPSSDVVGKKIEVWLNPAKPTSYYVDTGSLRGS